MHGFLLNISEWFMKVTVTKASLKDKSTVQNLGRFYVYEMSRYCGFLKGWETPANGLYECNDLSHYWKEPHEYPFLIKVDHELAGFVLVNKLGSTPDIEWNMGEFFIVSKYQGKGVGRKVAEQIFGQFLGVWEVMQIPENSGAITFWEKVIMDYSNGEFQKSDKIITKPKPHPMRVLKFRSKESN
jgi:predicted acetyltransferase